MSTADYTPGGWFDGDFAGVGISSAPEPVDLGVLISGTVELVQVPRIDHVARALERLPHYLAKLP